MIIQKDTIHTLLNTLSKEHSITPLTGGLTNKVYKIEHNKTGKTYVLKTGISLKKECYFMSQTSHINYHPIILKTGQFIDGDEYIMMEYKIGQNGKESLLSFTEKDWEDIGEQMAFILQQIHQTQIPTTIDQYSMIQDIIAFFALEKTKIIDYQMYYNQLLLVEKTLQTAIFDTVIIHGDFSPHNMVFQKKEDRFIITASLDPASRMYYGPREIDRAYVLNTRWVKNKHAFRKGFDRIYGNNTYDKLLYSIIERMMIMYLIETYYNLADYDAVDQLLLKFNNINS